MKILHMADIHARDKDIDEIKKCLEFIIEHADAVRPDLIIHAGDTFHSRDVKLDSTAAKLIVEAFCRLANIAPVAAVIGTPSHDGLAAEILPFIRGRHPIYLATKPEQIALLSPLEGGFTQYAFTESESPLAIISFLPPPTKEYFVHRSSTGIAGSDQEIAGALSGLLSGFGAGAADHPGCPHILVGHIAVSGAALSSGQTMVGREIEITGEMLRGAAADLACLGHIHKAQEVWPGAFYSGSIYRENWGETEDKGFYVHDLTPAGLGSKFIKTPARKLHRVQVDLCEDPELQDLNMQLYQSAPDEIQGASVRVELKLYQDEAEKIDREALERFYLEGDAKAKDVEIRIIRVPREAVRSSNILKLQTLREKLQEQAAIRGEMIAESILEKADLIEETPPDQVIEALANAV